ncbi:MULTISPECIES: PTS sugar transporter subunit IIB [Tatumella]|nr:MULTISPECIES: PTS sugar transporter subunit IIB [Tatumella]
MKRILLCCAAGMSTSMLVARMQKYASENHLAVEINAISINELEDHIHHCDCCLLGPQIKYKLSDIEEKLSPLNIPVAVINTMDYGMMRGDKVLESALAM